MPFASLTRGRSPCPSLRALALLATNDGSKSWPDSLDDSYSEVPHEDQLIARAGVGEHADSSAFRLPA